MIFCLAKSVSSEITRCLLHQRFDFAPVDVNLSHQSHIALIESLLVESIGSFELSVRGLHSFLCRNHLEVSAAHREDHQVSRIPRGELRGAIDLI